MQDIKYSKILVPTDGSDYSYFAGEHAVYLAKELGSKVYILNVVNTDMAFRTGIHYSEGLQALERSGNEATSKIRDICRENNVECEEIIMKGAPADTIIKVAEQLCVNCIVIGSIGMSAIERVLIGSVSEKVLRHAKCPVMLVRKR
ncbi:universal stress protein [Methanocella sp. CWC-04]|uniref:Universal stress protein n=2 Tax=Methanooceanicella nereidis TaxID=2052831 RepID=A0AAP2W6E6_9EURY|nr:universal stress protein [Methanocella sp. CWC-04]MCD1294194.1 universal stress protein [Methanocella sp. CWC-04]